MPRGKPASTPPPEVLPYSQLSAPEATARALTEHAMLVVHMVTYTCSTPAMVEPTTGGVADVERPERGDCTPVGQGLGGQDHLSCAALKGWEEPVARFQAHTLPLVSPA